MSEIWNSGLMSVGIIFIGLCVGSFLNVAIHRIPRGLSVNDPKRSFCPSCQTQLPAWQNLPVITWIVQAGKCRTCKAPIAFRYLLVEVVTGTLFFAAWFYLPMVSAMLATVLCTILVTVTFIDAEHQVIPTGWTTAGAVIAVAGSFLGPILLDLVGSVEEGTGVKQALLGWVVGFGSLYLVVILGKLAFGKWKRSFEEAETWRLVEGHGEDQQLHFVVGDEAHSWDDLFYRSQDRLRVEGHGFKVDGKRQPAKELIIQRDQVQIGDQIWTIENLKSLQGKATKLEIPREAMGMGDPHLLGMIGAFLGWEAVLFVVFAACLVAMAAALVTKVGFGKPLPFGPFLSIGALMWIFEGWRIWEWYFRTVVGAI